MARGNRIFAGPRLRQLRLDHRMDQATMAQALGISVSYLSQLENDDRPLTAKVKAAVASAFPTDWASFAGATTLALIVATSAGTPGLAFITTSTTTFDFTLPEATTANLNCSA